MARVVVAPEYGGPEVLQVVEQEVAPPAQGQVQLSVRAAGVNPSDYKRIRGGFGKAQQPPLRVGNEVSGVVTAVGEDAVGEQGAISVGDEVVAYRVSGGFATDLNVPATTVFPKPAGLGWDEGAGLLLTGATAYHLIVATGITAGDTVLIHGCSGSVGLLAAQLAIHAGARVIGTASDRNFDLLRRFGITPVRYGDGLVSRVKAAAHGPIDAALDTIGTDEAIYASIDLVDDRSRIATINNFTLGGEFDGIKLLGGGPGADPGTEIRNAARPQLIRLAGDGVLQVVLGPSFPLDRVVEALTLVESGHAGGKVVLHP